MSQTAAESFCVTRHAVDPRADDARRLVHISASSVIIERTVDGVRMRVAVPVSTYRDLALVVRAPSGQALLRLCHDDPDLEVVLASGEGVEVARRARAWSEALTKPVRVDAACVAVGTAVARRTKRGAKASRRSAFSRRRKPGQADRLGVSFAHEHEIIARS